MSYYINNRRSSAASRRDSLERRTTVWQSLRSLGIDDDISPSCSTAVNTVVEQQQQQQHKQQPHQEKNKRHYARRGSVTRYQMEAPTEQVQPSNLCKSQRRRRRQITDCPLIAKVVATTKQVAPSPRIRQQRRKRATSVTTTTTTTTTQPTTTTTTKSPTTTITTSRTKTPKSNNNNNKANNKKYRRRGSVTKYSLDGSTHETENKNKSIQPSTHSCSMKRRSIHFGNVYVYEFPTVLGDNPSIRSGAPIALGPRCYNEIPSVYTVNMYELCHRAAEEQGAGVEVVPVQERALMLLRAGHTIYQIGDATLQANLIKKQRLETLQKSSAKNREQMALLVESASRALKRIVAPSPPPPLPSSGAPAASTTEQQDYSYYATKPTFVTAKTA